MRKGILLIAAMLLAALAVVAPFWVQRTISTVELASILNYDDVAVNADSFATIWPA